MGTLVAGALRTCYAVCSMVCVCVCDSLPIVCVFHVYVFSILGKAHCRVCAFASILQSTSAARARVPRAVFRHRQQWWQGSFMATFTSLVRVLHPSWGHAVHVPPSPVLLTGSASQLSASLTAAVARASASDAPSSGSADGLQWVVVELVPDPASAVSSSNMRFKLPACVVVQATQWTLCSVVCGSESCPFTIYNCDSDTGTVTGPASPVAVTRAAGPGRWLKFDGKTQVCVGCAVCV
jgi:hypothetical protein